MNKIKKGIKKMKKEEKRWCEISFEEFVEKYNKRLNNNDRLSECSLQYIYDYHKNDDDIVDYDDIIDTWKQGITEEEIEDTYDCNIQMCDELDNGGVIACVENNY